MGASAQVQDLPAGLVQQASQIDAGGEAQIREYLKQPLEMLGGDDPEKLRIGRGRILEMVGPQRSPSVPFRLAYSRVLTTELDKLMGEGEMAQINALVVAGELATDGAMELLEKGRKSATASVRFQAAAGAERTITLYNQGVAVNAAALAEGTTLSLLRALGETLKTEADALVLDKSMAALAAAVQNARLREEAVKQLDEGLLALGEKYKGKAVPVELLQAFGRVSSDLRQALLSVGAGGLTQNVQAGAGGIAATIAWMTNTSIKAKVIAVGAGGETIRQHVGAAVGAAESLGNFVTQNAQAFDLSAKIRRGDNAGDAEFLDASQRFVGLMQSKARVAATRYK